jgi:indolepyruvate ferredoxin oxidoreductase alpha subunit
MLLQEFNGDQALAWGAIVSGVRIVTSYPGSPSSGTVDAIIEQAGKYKIHVEWSTNEKVAMEMGIGASMAGRRALVCVKSVGMNTMIDPLMALNLTPVKGGLVILLGDDPGGYASQNDQDTRPIVQMLEMPLLEPASPAEAYELAQEAFTISEKLNTVVIIRETRSFTQKVEKFAVYDESIPEYDLGFKRETWRFVPVPKNAVQKHKQLHEILDRTGIWAEGLRFNRDIGKGNLGIIAAGFTFSKLMDILGGEVKDDLSVLKLCSLFPLPEKKISGFLKKCSRVLILEENEPFVEKSVKALAFDNDYNGEILGKDSGHVSREGELFRWQIQNTLHNFIPGFIPAVSFLEENEENERPLKENNCTGCGYNEVIDILDEASRKISKKYILIGDPGCLVTVGERLDGKFAMGSAVAVADGISKIMTEEKAVAMFGDSSFFHTTLPAICNAVVNRSNVLMIVLDNKSSAASGHQPNPGVGKDAGGNNAPDISIEGTARASGVKDIRTVRHDDRKEELTDVFVTGLASEVLSMIIIKIPAPS